MAQFYTDENVSERLAEQLRLLGHDVVSTYDAHRIGSLDHDQLTYATQQDRIVITHNREDFILLHDVWQQWSRLWNVRAEHTGILIVPQAPSHRPAELATQIDTLIRSQAHIVNALHRWEPETGWERREP